MPIKYGNFHIARKKSGLEDSGQYTQSVLANNLYPGAIGEHIPLKDQAKLFKTTGLAEIQISVYKKVGGSEDSAQYAYEEDVYNASILTNLQHRGNNAFGEGSSDFKRVTLKQKTLNDPSHFDTVWKFGNSIRIYSDGTTPNINYIDSNVFRGGADFGLVFKDSNWSDFGGILSNSTASAPDSSLRNTAYSDSELYDYYPILSNFGPGISEEGRMGDHASIKTFTDLYTLEMEDSFSYTNRFFQGAIDAAESDGAASGGGGGGGAAADPEAWS